MEKILALLLLLIPAAAWGGSSIVEYTGTYIESGSPLLNAKVYVSRANCSASSICRVDIYSDSVGTALKNPILTNGSGVYDFWAYPGIYRVVDLTTTPPYSITVIGDLPVATTSVSGLVTLATNGGTTSTTAVAANDSRLSDSRTPTTHASSHQTGGSDPIALDTLAAATDVTTLNSSTSAHGLLKKLDNVSTHFLDGTGAWTVPATATALAANPTDCSANQFSTAIAANGDLTCAQPAFTDLSGSIAASQLPNPGAASLGGVQSKASVASNFLTQISTSGVVSAAQPDFSDLSSTISLAQSPVTSIAAFGNGQDGVVTCSGSSTLARDMYYSNLTLSAGCAITTAGYRIFVSGTLDITAAPAGAIKADGTAGTATANTAAGAAPSACTVGAMGCGYTGGVGLAGGTAGGSQAAAPAVTAPGDGGTGGNGSAGGLGASGAGGTIRNATALTNFFVQRLDPNLLRGITLISGGGGGVGGSSGGGDGTAGGGSGSGGNGGGIVWVAANTISRGGSTTAGCIRANGGTGGNSGVGAAGNRGGGGGAGGGGGGWVTLVYGTLSGSTATNAIEASGAAGGNGGNGLGTGVGGNGGSSGMGGRIHLFDLSAGSLTISTGSAGSAGNAASGTTAGTGASINTFRVSL